MKITFVYKHSSFKITLLAILILAMFFSYSSSDIFKSLNKTKQLTEMNNNIKGYTETLARNNFKMKTGLETNKEVIVTYFPSLDSGENILQKIEMDYTSFYQYNKWLLFQFLFFILLYLYKFFEYIKEWIIQISQSRFDLFMVHCMELKDGKKNALSTCQTF